MLALSLCRIIECVCVFLFLLAEYAIDQSNREQLDCALRHQLFSSDVCMLSIKYNFTHISRIFNLKRKVLYTPKKERNSQYWYFEIFLISHAIL